MSAFAWTVLCVAAVVECVFIAAIFFAEFFFKWEMSARWSSWSACLWPLTFTSERFRNWVDRRTK